MPARVLIIEDEFLIAADMESMLDECGHDCIGIADDFESARQFSEQRPEIALVDVNLSDGATGPAIAAYLAREIGTSIIFVTANPRQINARIPGALGIVSKPVEVNLICEAVAYAYELRRGSPTPAPPPGLQLLDA